MKAFLKTLLIITAATCLVILASLIAAPVPETGALQLQGEAARDFLAESGILTQLSGELSSTAGRNFLEAMPVKAHPGDSGDFGVSVAISGDTALIGAPLADGNDGAAFVFIRNNDTWLRLQKLTPSESVYFDQFGLSVAMQGDMAIIGAPGEKGGMVQGAAYVFKRDGLMWKEAQKLSATDGTSADGFGSSVDLDGPNAIVGAAYATVGENKRQGAAYLFTYGTNSWVGQRKIVAGDGEAGDFFGISVALDGDTAVVGAHLAGVGDNEDQGAAYVFARNGSAWSQQQKLTASDGEAGDRFGKALDVDRGTILIGAWNTQVNFNPGQGAAYIFIRSGDSWIQRQRLTVKDGAEGDRFGISVALDRDTAFIGATGRDYETWRETIEDQGAAYLFTRSGGVWTRRQVLIDHNGEPDELFGGSVALDGDTAIIGAVGVVSGFPEAGTFFVTERGPQPWLLRQRVDDSKNDGCGGYGYAVALEDDTAIVGAGTHFGDEGTAYFFAREGAVWIEKQRIDVNGGATSIALDGDTAVIGAPDDDISTSGDSLGSAHVFVRENGTWKTQQKLVAGNGSQYANFGTAVALKGDTILAGAPWQDRKGAAYVFNRKNGSWNEEQILQPADGSYFGDAVALDGETAIVGATGGPGAAYVFKLTGAKWVEQQKLVAGDAANRSDFGNSIDLDGETAVIADVYRNAAYIFTWNGSLWLEQQKLVANDGDAYRRLGRSVSLDGDTAVIGAVRANIGPNVDQGAAYVFVRSDGRWSNTQKIIAPDGTPQDVFGYPALDGNTVLAGAPGGEAWCSQAQRSAYFFESLKFVQTIDFPWLPAGQIGDIVPLEATAGSGLDVSFTSNSVDICSVDGSTATLLTHGLCSITAAQNGDETYAAAQDVTQTFNVNLPVRAFVPAVFLTE